MRRIAAAALFTCALACGAREPASAEELAELYFARLAHADLAGLEALYAPDFLASMERTGTPWRAQLEGLAKRRGALQAFELTTVRMLPTGAGTVQFQLTYRVTYARENGVEQLTVRASAQEGEPLQIVAHAISG
jgi:hypothetical protein